MKKVLLLSLLVLASCKNQSEEVKVEEMAVDNPVATISQKDTMVELQVDEAGNNNKIEKHSVPVTSSNSKYVSFGAKMNSDKAIGKTEMLKKYKTMKTGDTVAVQFKSVIKEVCKKKGCWMSMELPDDKEAFVKFKDYGFFVPLNADNSEAIVSGKAYIDVVSVAELQHFAKDGGKSQEEINKIVAPKVTYAFQADGVLIGN